jgi:hypothetical protein
MNRFVYLVHTGYRQAGARVDTPIRGAARSWERLAQLGSELMSYLPDSDAQIVGERMRRDPDVIRVTVVTTLEEEVADSAFVRFIQGCKVMRPVEEAAGG